MATIFSYKDVKSNKMDTGLTEHSGCPITEKDDEKWIVTAWMRQGVDRDSSYYMDEAHHPPPYGVPERWDEDDEDGLVRRLFCEESEDVNIACVDKES